MHTTNQHPDDPDGQDGRVPVAPILSIFDPIYLGIDEYGQAVYVSMIYRNMLIGGEPGGGKSTLLSSIIAHCALCHDARLCLLDGKQVELGLWEDIADVFVGPNLGHAIATLRRLQTVMDNRYRLLKSRRERKITKGHDLKAIVVPIDEIALYSATFGSNTEQETFSILLRDVVARGRAVGIIVVGATQRPSSDIIPTSLRDLFSWRFATRCTTEASSDIILGRGWAEQGYDAHYIAPEDLGVGYLLAEGGQPRLIRGAYLSDDDIIRVAQFAAWTRNTTPPATPPQLQPDPEPEAVRRPSPKPHTTTIHRPTTSATPPVEATR